MSEAVVAGGARHGIRARAAWTRVSARAPDAAGAALALVCLLVWWQAARGIDPTRMNDLGLASVMPGRMFGSLLVLTLGFCLVLRRQPLNGPLLGLFAVVLVLMLYGVTSLTQEIARFNVTWRHAGVIEHIMRNEEVDPKIDAYFNWPGFFALGAMFTKLTGFRSAVSLAGWAPVYFNLLYLGPLVILFRALSCDRRVTACAVWLFLVTNWVGQDYFSPQAVAYFLYLSILAVVLTWFTSRQGDGRWFSFGRKSGRQDPPDHLPPRPDEMAERPATTSGQRMGLALVVILAFAVMVASHQLSPFATLAAVLALVVIRRSSLRGLPVVMTMMVLGWLTYLATAYLQSRLHLLLAEVGDISNSASANVSQRLRGSADHLLVVRVRLLMTGAIGAVAFVGWLRRVKRGHLDVVPCLLIAAPVPLVVVQPYGGEMLLRVYFFALPFLALLAAAAFFPSTTSRSSWVPPIALFLVSASLTAGFVFARYGNERINEFTTAELTTVGQLYEMAPEGALLVAATGNLPWRYRGYDDYDYTTVEKIGRDLGRATPRIRDVLATLGQASPGCAYLIITRTEKAYADLLGVWPAGAADALETEARASPQLGVRYENQDGVIFAPTTTDTVAAGPDAAAGRGGTAPPDCRR